MLTLEQLLVEMNAATNWNIHPSDERGFLTQDDLARKLGMSVKRFRAALAEMQSKGRLEIMKVHRPRLDGGKKSVTVFKVLPEKPVKKPRKTRS
jgi:hypothetical protein